MKLDLDTIAATLESLEETIIARFLDRAQFALNECAYQVGESGFPGREEESFFSERLRQHEEMDAVFGRYMTPEERPFRKGLPPPVRHLASPEHPFPIRDFNCVNVTEKIISDYRRLLPRLCIDDDDGNCGSTVERDVMALQALSRRIHYGSLYVAESKYRMDEHRYKELIEERNMKAIDALLTRKEVEEKIIRRVGEKTKFIQAASDKRIRKMVDPEIIVDFYRRTIIPLTKEGELLYFLHRNRTQT